MENNMLEWNGHVQAVLDLRTYDCRTTCTLVRYKFSPLIRLSDAEFGFFLHSWRTCFELLHSDAVKLSPDLYFVSNKCPKDRSQWPHGLRRGSTAARWYCGFEYLRGHGYLSFVIVVFCQIKFSAAGRSPLQRCPTECGVCKAWITRACFTRYSPASELVANKLVTPVTRRNENAGQSGIGALDERKNFSVLFASYWLAVSITLSECTSGWTDLNFTRSDLVASEFKSC